MKANSMKEILVTYLQVSALTLTLFVTASAQTKPEQAAVKTDPPPQPHQAQTAKEDVGPKAASSRPYRRSGRDQFKKTVKPRTAKGKQPAHLLGLPSRDVRRAEFRQKVDAAL